MQKKQNLADPTIKSRYLSYKDSCKVFGLGMTRMQEYAKAAGATYKLGGNKVLVNVEIFEAYLQQYRIPGEHEEWVKKRLNLK